MGRKRLRACAVAVAVLGVVAAPSSALAAPSAYDQYVPLVPSASGPAPPGGHGHRGGSTPLSPAAATRLGQLRGANRSQLAAIATSQELGAPSSPASSSSSAGASDGSGATGSGGTSATLAGHTTTSGLPHSSSTLSAASDALGRSPFLPLALFAAVACALAAGIVRRARA